MNAARVCEQCGWTLAEFHARGLLGCPECYGNLGDALAGDLLHLHPELHRIPSAPAPAENPDSPAALRERLGDALRGERYEEAAALRERLRDADPRGPDRAP